MKKTKPANNNINSLKQEIKLLKQQLSQVTNSDKNSNYVNEYEGLYHNIPMGIMHYDSKGVIVDCNDIFVNIIGSTHKQLVGLDMFNRLDDNVLTDALKESLESGTARYEGYYKSVTANKVTPVKILFHGIKDKNNNIIGGICIAEDTTESINNQLALKESEENYKLIFENTTDVYYRVDMDGNILAMSPAIKDILLIDNYEDIIGHNVLDYYIEKTDRNLFIDKLKTDGYVKEYRIDLKRSNGKPITVEFNSKIMKNKDGKFDGMIGVFYDVTSRIEAEVEKLTNIWFFERLENLDKVIRSAVDINQVYDGVVSAAIESFQCDSAFVLGYKNGVESRWDIKASAESDNTSFHNKHQLMIADPQKSDEIFDRILMYEKLIVIDNNNIEELNDISKEMGVKAQMMTSIHANSGNSLILCINHCDDERVWNNHEKALFTEIASRLADATNTFESTKLLLKSEAHHRRLIEATTEGYCEINPNGVIKVVNNAMCQMLGFSMNEIIGKSSLVFTSPDSRKTLGNVINEITDESDDSFEIELHHKNGSKVYTLFNVTRRLDENKNNIGAFFFITNITKQKEALNKAEESDKLKSVFIKNISHEVRTPLNGIVGFLEMLNDESITREERLEFTKYIIASSDQLVTIITDLLEYSRLEAGQVDTNFKSFSINTLLDDLYLYFISFVDSRNKSKLNLVLEKPLPDEQSNIITDKVMVKQIFSSLINNAIKFTERGEVKFGYKILDEDNIRFYVLDSGVGIPESDKEIIFEKFRNGTNTTNAVYGGNGLGLSISKSLTDLIGGHIWYESEVGVGTKFYVNVPISKSENVTRGKYFTPKIISTKDWTKKKVLIVDDVFDVYKLISVYLRDTKIQIIYAKNGSEAIELVNKNPDIDIVLLDIQLPDMDGYEVVKIIKELRNNLPVIAQTAFALNDDKEKTIKAGFDDYTTKPIYRKTLLEFMNKYI